MLNGMGCTEAGVILISLIFGKGFRNVKGDIFQKGGGQNSSRTRKQCSERGAKGIMR